MVGVAVDAAFGKKVEASDYVAAGVVGAVLNPFSFAFSAGDDFIVHSIKDLFPKTAKEAIESAGSSSVLSSLNALTMAAFKGARQLVRDLIQ